MPSLEAKTFVSGTIPDASASSIFAEKIPLSLIKICSQAVSGESTLIHLVPLRPWPIVLISAANPKVLGLFTLNSTAEILSPINVSTEVFFVAPASPSTITKKSPVPSIDSKLSSSDIFLSAI